MCNPTPKLCCFLCKLKKTLEGRAPHQNEDLHSHGGGPGSGGPMSPVHTPVCTRSADADVTHANSGVTEQS